MKLELTTEQVNQILNALAQQPYIQVNELIKTIQQQGQQQLQTEEATTNTNSVLPMPNTGKNSELVKELATETLESKNGKSKI